VQQEDNFVIQVDKENDEEEVVNILITGCLNSEQDKEEKSAPHATQVELEATMQDVEDHQLSCETREDTCLFVAEPLCVELKDAAAVPHLSNLKFIHQEVPSHCMNTSDEDPTRFVPCISADCGESTCLKAVQNFALQHGKKSVTNFDQEVGNISNFEDACNLNLKANHSLSLRVECEKKDVCVVPSSGSDKSIQDEVHQAPTNLQFQTNVVTSMNKMPRCVVPSAAICDELLDSGAEIMCSNISLNVEIEGKINAHDSTSTDASLASFEEVKDDYSATSNAIPMPLQKTINDDTYSYVAPQDVEEIVHQYPCDNESHIAKLSRVKTKVSCVTPLNVRMRAT
jgi:hypothetical protein